MATSFGIILRETVKHLNAFASGSASTVQTNYTTATLTTAQVPDPFFNLDFIKDKIVDTHGRLALEIANVRQHPWRSFLGNSVTAGLSNGDALPTTDTNGDTIIGAYGQVMGGSEPMTEGAPERVRAYLLNPTDYNHPYLYYIDGNRIYHTASATVTINVCTYERSDVAALMASTPPGNITLPDVLADALVAGSVAECIIEAKGIEQASYYMAAFQKAIDSIRQGMTTFPMRTLPATA